MKYSPDSGDAECLNFFLSFFLQEFTIAHQDALSDAGKRDGRRRGLCILSEFSSCTRVMRGALHVNPWKVRELRISQRESFDVKTIETDSSWTISCRRYLKLQMHFITPSL